MFLLVSFNGKTDPEFQKRKKFGKIEFWNLKKIEFDEYIDRISKLMPAPLGSFRENLLIAKEKRVSDIGIRKSEYQELSWAMLLPIDGTLASVEDFHILSGLYNDTFIQPAFIATEYGIHKNNQFDETGLMYSPKSSCSLFFNKSFSKFVNEMSPILGNFRYNSTEIGNWNEIKWRFFYTLQLFNRTKKYFKKKYPLVWQEEFAQIGTIFELLLSTGDEKTHLTYKLKKRCGAVVQTFIPDYEKKIRKMYELRSSFVHGSFYKNLNFEKDEDNFFNIKIEPRISTQTEDVREILRLIIITALLKYAKTPEEDFADFVEEAILDDTKRSELVHLTKRGYKIMS